MSLIVNTFYTSPVNNTSIYFIQVSINNISVLNGWFLKVALSLILLLKSFFLLVHFVSFIKNMSILYVFLCLFLHTILYFILLFFHFCNLVLC